MDINGFIHSLTAADFVLAIIVVCAFGLGYAEGTGRVLIALLAWAFAWVLAANLRTPLGNPLSGYWGQFSLEYTMMIAFLVAFVATLGVCTVVIVMATKRSSILAGSQLLDPLLAGTLAVVVTVLIIAGVEASLDTVYRAGLPLNANDVSVLSSTHEALANSAIGHWIDSTVVPILTSVTGPLIPDEFARLIRG
jgi:hypothetical protein